MSFFVRAVFFPPTQKEAFACTSPSHRNETDAVTVVSGRPRYRVGCKSIQHWMLLHPEYLRIGSNVNSVFGLTFTCSIYSLCIISSSEHRKKLILGREGKKLIQLLFASEHI